MHQSEQCHLCFNPVDSYSEIITHSLFGKYSSAQNYHYTRQVDEVLEQNLSPAYVQFQQNNYRDEEEEYLKRQYQLEQYEKKIEMLSQYYKFHRDIPTWNNLGVQKIMGRYYNRMKDVDYKRIKEVLKKQQNISLSTHKSFSSFGSDEDYTKKSRYSTMLGELNHDEDSVVLLGMCDTIGKALKKVKVQNNFKGNYYSGEKKFEQFLKKQKKRKQNISKKQQLKRHTFGVKKLKFNPKLNTKNDELGLREVNFASNHSLKGRYTGRKVQKSIEKTTANQTISRQEKIKRSKSKSNFKPISSGRNSIGKKIAINDNLITEMIKTKAFTSIQNMISRDSLKTINQIYKPSQKTMQSPFRKNRQLSLKTIRFRSNSQHTLPQPKQTLKQQKNAHDKINRSRSKSKFSESMAKRETIDLTTQNKCQLTSQNSTKTLRSSRSGLKISRDKSNQNKKGLGINVKREIGNGKRDVMGKREVKKKNTVIESMLEKKLQIFKKKQAVF